MNEDKRLDISKIDLEKHFLKSKTSQKIHGAGKPPYVRGESSCVFTTKKIELVTLNQNGIATGGISLIKIDNPTNKIFHFNEIDNSESLNLNEYIFYSSNKNLKTAVDLFIELTNKFPKKRFHLGIELDGNICNDIATTKALRIYISNLQIKPSIIGILNTEVISKIETLIFNSYLCCIEKIVNLSEKVDTLTIERKIEKTHNSYKLNSPIDPFYGNSEIIKQTNNLLNLLNKKN